MTTSVPCWKNLPEALPGYRYIHAFGGRSAPMHTLNHVAPFCHEDIIEFNTQSSSQWDGLRYFAFRSTNVFYNNYVATDFRGSDDLGVQAWAEKGGIIGRGVLVDFKSWAEATGVSFNVNGGTPISLRDVQAILRSQGTEIKQGDILSFRTGHDALCVQNEPGSHQFIGLKSEEAFVEWLWNHQIAAVAGDQPAFESTPPPLDGGFGWLHELLLAGLGCPIGELWDTEGLARACRERGSYSFFLSSCPLVLEGGAASTANAVAIL
ncbi:hypothetical protein BJX70DRAFT_408656 [Aspergillus crustosus]